MLEKSGESQDRIGVLLLLVTVLIALLSPSLVFASCLPENCQILEFSVESCSFVTLNNEDDIRELTHSEGEIPEAWLKLKNEINGAVIKASGIMSENVACGANGHVVEAENTRKWGEGTAELFYESSDPQICDKLKTGKISKFYYPTCCDTLPSSGVCIAKRPVIKDIPSYFQDN